MAAPTLSVLPQRLLLVKTKGSGRSGLEVIRAALQRVIFFAPKAPLFCYTETDDEVSVLMEERVWASFPPDALVVSPGVWRVLELFQGPAAVETVGIVSRLTGPLAARAGGFELLCWSTFDADLLAVKEERLTEAHTILAEQLKRWNAAPAAAAVDDTKTPAAPTSLLTAALKQQSATAAAPTTALGASPAASAQTSPNASTAASPSLSPNATAAPASAANNNSQSPAAAFALAPSAAAARTANASAHNKLSVSVFPNRRLRVLGFRDTAISTFAHALLAVTLLPDPPLAPSTAVAATGSTDPEPARASAHFFSLSYAHGEVSVVLDEQWVDLFTRCAPGSTLASVSVAEAPSATVDAKQPLTATATSVPSSALRVQPDRWTALLVLDGASGYNPTKVSQLSAVLARVGVSIYYVSSIDSDFVLVLDKDLAKGIAALTADPTIRLDTEADA